MLSSILKIEKLLKCDICLSTLRQTRTLGDCGHRFCLDCILPHIKKKGICATCEFPAKIEDMKRDAMHDNLVAYVGKLKRALLSHSLTPLEDSLLRREIELEEGEQEQVETITPNKRVLLDISTQDSEDLEQEYRDNTKRFKQSMSSEDFINELISSDSRPSRRNKNVPPPSYVLAYDDKDEEMEEVPPAAITAPTLVGAPVEEDVDIPTADIPEFSVNPLRTPKATETSNKKWECKECHYKSNLSYMQVCGLCKKSKNRKIKTPPIATRTRRRSSSNHHEEEHERTLESATILSQPRTTRHMEAVIKKEVHIIQTSLTDHDFQLMEKSSEKVAETPLKVTMYTELKYFEDVTHVISSVDSKRQCHRTLKYLHGLLLGKWIVSTQWYVDSIKAKTWLKEEDYEILGDARAGITHAPKKGRLEYSDDHRLFTDMNFHLIGEFTDKHNKKDIGTLIQVGGGKFNTRKPTSKGSSKQQQKKIDTTKPIIICSSSTKQHWVKEYQWRDPAWVIGCISKLKVE